MFTSNSATDWGISIGEGVSILGSFNGVIAPRLEETVLNPTEIGCNEIRHDGAPGLIVLPDGRFFTSHYQLWINKQKS